MKVKVTEPKSWQRVLEIEVPAVTVNGQIDSVYKEYQQKAVLPGFRKGKVPLSILKAKFSDSIEQTALQELIPRVWEEARQQKQIDPISQPVVSELDFKPGQPLKFKASVEVRPEIHITEYTNLRVTEREVRISEEDVQQSLEALQDRHATIAPSDGAAGETDIVIVDFWKVGQSGIPIVGQKTTNYPIDLSSPNVFQEYKQALVGAAVGDQKRVSMAYPADHPQKDLAGQEVSFLLKVNEIKKKTLPPLNDEFAKALGDFSTLKALQEAIRKSLQEQEEQKVRRDMEEQIIDQIIEKNPFDVPESMVAGYVETLLSNLHPDQKKEEDLEQLRKSYRPLAIRYVRRWFILEEVRKEEDIQVTKNELNVKVRALAKARGANEKKLHQQLTSSGQLHNMRRNLEEEKTLGFIVSKAKIQTVPPNSGTELDPGPAGKTIITGR